MLRYILGQIFDSTLDRYLTQPFCHFLAIFPFFKFFKMCSNHYFIGFSAKKCHFLLTPKKLETLFVNTTVLTDCFDPFFCIFIFGGFCCVRFFGPFFLKGMKNKYKKNWRQNNQKLNKTTRCKPVKHLALLTKKKADNTDTKQCNFIV